MRIDSFNPIIAADAPGQSGKLVKHSSLTGTNQTYAPTSQTEDTTSLTSSTTTVRSLTQNALAASPARAAHVASLKAAVSGGEYKLDSRKTAEALASADV